MNKNTKIKVTNRSAGTVGYTIPELGNYSRRFTANESKTLPFEEVQKLSYIPGGAYLLQHYLVIDNIEARDEILGSVELEYDYTEQDVKKMLEYGPIEQLLDCLDFAPKGVIELVKKIAVEIELNDLRKRKAIQDKIGFNISAAIQINEETDENENKAEETQASRRYTPNATVEVQSEEKPVRKYNVNKK